MEFLQHQGVIGNVKITICNQDEISETLNKFFLIIDTFLRSFIPKMQTTHFVHCQQN